MAARGLLCFMAPLVIMAVEVCLLRGAQAKTHRGDIEVLKQLKDAVDPASVTPGSCLASWDFAYDPCDSLFSDRFTCGFRCDSIGSNRITEIALDQAGYSSASLSAVHWSHLPLLQSLDLSGNSFSGPIPAAYSLSNLTRLSLSRNFFSGSIPASLGPSLPGLHELFLDNNAIDGAIPETLNSLTSLVRLELQANKLAGAVPELASLRALSYLDLSDNALSGSIPSLLPPYLVQISMRNNLIEGTVPPTVQSLTYLQVLDLSHNRLSGPVPSVLFTHPSLQQLTLSFNGFDSIEAPNSLMAMQVSELIAADLSNNRIRGFLPMFMSLLPKLSALSMENNLMSGMIPTEYAIRAAIPGPGVAQLGRLLLGGNYLFGPIPGPFLGMSADSVVNVSLADNCLYRCPGSFFFCQGATQKSLMECKRFGPIIP
ncbi:hypothetical protein SAY86_032138 [Trapa natans]|uniref:Leucine-rich repeat-containing N-terminal plant-type domain-containing protein n=1 Tax=Trapa natans TaxID=22666 RepID=A0AAN7M8N5_TRANT|nr:hypothetical protein SAY86_032138 [Trapa natans]